MRKERQKIGEKLSNFIKSKSNEIYNLTDLNRKKSIEELKCEDSEQEKLNEKHNREWTLCCSNLEKSKDELTIFIKHKVNHYQKEKLDEYNLLNLEHLEKLLLERKKSLGNLFSIFTQFRKFS